uniref:Uncharacterized protein n=1 Tax=Anopheles dirus TaxID=7168 RepID=A0A182N8B8_9DIPT
MMALEYKEFIDAEGLMPLPTSDFHTTVCMEMRMLKNSMNNNCITTPNQFGPSTISYPYPYMDTPIKQPANYGGANGSAPNGAASHSNGGGSGSNGNGGGGAPGGGTFVNSNSNNGDLASVDSSDTYASCQTHPFLSQADLTSDIAPFDVADRGSHVSLNETPVPKHRKTRFQQSTGTATTALAVATAARPKTRFENLKSSIESLEDVGATGSSGASGSGGGSKKSRRSSFMPAKSLASATKLINQHLFGIPNPAPKDSLETSPQLETHRRSKSILKNKSEASRLLSDPESERLLADNMSGSGISDNGANMGSDSNTDYSGSTMIATSITPLVQRHRLTHQRSTPASLGATAKPLAASKFSQPRYSQEEVARQSKPQLTRGVGIGTYVDHLTGDRRLDSGTRESSTESETAFSTYLAASNSNSNKDKASFAGSSLTSSDESKTTTSRGNSVENHGGSSGYGASSS